VNFGGRWSPFESRKEPEMRLSTPLRLVGLALSLACVQRVPAADAFDDALAGLTDKDGPFEVDGYSKTVPEGTQIAYCKDPEDAKEQARAFLRKPGHFRADITAVGLNKTFTFSTDPPPKRKDPPKDRPKIEMPEKPNVDVTIPYNPDKEKPYNPPGKDAPKGEKAFVGKWVFRGGNVPDDILEVNGDHSGKRTVRQTWGGEESWTFSWRLDGKKIILDFGDSRMSYFVKDGKICNDENCLLPFEKQK
jgi:hypothetical protein